MEQSFKLSRGAFAPANFTPFEKLIYYIGTLICSMILMTILISVVAGTFARVRLNANQTKAMQLADLILEVENVLFWKRDLHKTGYITICLADWDSDKEKSTDDRVKAIESKVEVLASDVANL